MGLQQLYSRAFRPARPRRQAVAWLAAGTAILAAASGCAASATAGVSSDGPTAISINAAECGAAWHLAAPGWHTFSIRNASIQAAEVDLINPANGAIYAEIENMGPATTRSMRLNVGSGRYAFRCLLEDIDAFTGPSETVPGHQRGEAAILPVTNNDLYSPAEKYHAYVTAGLKVLVSQVRTLVGDVQAGRLGPARTDWLPAHLTYERLGAAYDSFGDYDGEIDGRATGLAGGVHDSKFTGFYRLEYGLWHGQSAKDLGGPASALLRDVLALQKAWPNLQQDLLDIGLRAHEILENALQFQLTGIDDYGSGTTLATTSANITGTRELLTLLHPLLVKRYTGLAAVNTWLNRLQTLLNAQHSSGHWTPVGHLGTSTREQINAATSQVLQELAPVAAITEPRRS